MQRQCGKEADESIQARGERCKPSCGSLQATSKPPGKTGTGAPVTEHLRCSFMERIRVVPRLQSPLSYDRGVVCFRGCNSMHDRKRMRLPGWDYSGEGTYFLTLCSKDRKSLFSRIVGRGIPDAPEVHLSNYGNCVKDALLFLIEKHPEMVFHHWVIMPNHVHILVSLQQSCAPGTGASGMPHPTNAAIPKLISSLKRFTNRKTGQDLWQNGYYDHIIRDEADFLKRWQYIENNPAAWLEDDYFID